MSSPRLGHRLLGDGADAAPQRRRHDPRDRQLPAAARQHRTPGCRPLTDPRPQQRPGRSHHGHLGEDAATRSWTRSRDEFGFDPPREHGWDTVDSIRAMRDGKVDVFFALGGNFVAATPDTAVTERAMANCRLTVHVATKLNRSHLCHGTRGADPALPRTHRTRHAGQR